MLSTCCISTGKLALILTLVGQWMLLSSGTGNDAIIAEVLRIQHGVYQADLEKAIREMLFNEIPKVKKIQGEQLLALKRMVQVLANYHPFGEKGERVIRGLNEFVFKASGKLSGINIVHELARLDTPYSPVFSALKYVGCVSSLPNKRGYKCALWTLFHYLTIQALRSDTSNDPLEVLTAMHGYVKFFFGCEECSNNFQEMALRRRMWNVSSKAEAALWLWEAHNEVNSLLADDGTEDPAFPKIQFPSESSCPQCRKPQRKSTINWDRGAVLEFLLSIYHPGCIRFYGTDNEDYSSSSIRYRV